MDNRKNTVIYFLAGIDVVIAAIALVTGIIFVTIPQVKEWGIFGLLGRLSPSNLVTLWYGYAMFRYGIGAFGIVALCWILLIVLGAFIEK